MPIALGEFMRVLKPDGFVVVKCPDLREIAAMIANDKLGDVIYQSEAGPVTAHDVVFGYQPMLAQGQFYMAHKSGFTLKHLAETLSKAGFGTVHGRRDRVNFELEAIATKHLVGDDDVLELADQYLRNRISDRPAVS